MSSSHKTPTYPPLHQSNVVAEHPPTIHPEQGTDMDPDLFADRKALKVREDQLLALRKAMTVTCWAGVCDELPAARGWFDDAGKLR